MTRSPSVPLSRRAGFSLLEMLMVVALMALLGTLMIYAYDRIFGQTQDDVARLFVRTNAKLPLTKYRIDTGAYPTTEDGLAALVSRPPHATVRWRGPYLEQPMTDPWGRPYQYACPGIHRPESYDLWSLGRDGIPSADDIGNWQ